MGKKSVGGVNVPTAVTAVRPLLTADELKELLSHILNTRPAPRRQGLDMLVVIFIFFFYLSLLMLWGYIVHFLNS